MGFALCRFHEETGCSETGGQEYRVHLQDLNIMINVPSMWKHYMDEHLVQPTELERDVVMSADPTRATGQLIRTRSSQRSEEIKVMYVEKTDTGYTHQIGTKSDVPFINKLETILNKIQPLQTKGIGPVYR